MKKTLKIAHAILAIIMLFGMIFGPISWMSSASFFSEYASFEKGAISLSGRVSSKRFELGYRSGVDYVTIGYSINGKVHFREIIVERPLWSHLSAGQKVNLWYNSKKKDRIKLKMENESRFLPPLLKRGLGKWTTIICYALLLLQISFKNQINKKLGWKTA